MTARSGRASGVPSSSATPTLLRVARGCVRATRRSTRWTRQGVRRRPPTSGISIPRPASNCPSRMAPISSSAHSSRTSGSGLRCASRRATRSSWSWPNDVAGVNASRRGAPSRPSPDARCNASSTASRADRRRWTSTCPWTVGSTRRVFRVKSSVPSVRSRRWTEADTDCWVRWRRRAAAVKVPSSATATTALSWRSSTSTTTDCRSHAESLFLSEPGGREDSRASRRREISSVRSEFAAAGGHHRRHS